MLSTSLLLKVWWLWVLTCVLACAQESATPDTAGFNLQLILEQMRRAQLDSTAKAAYQVIREYRLFSENRSSPTSEVWAEIDYLPPNQKTFLIQKREGSSRAEDVVRRILQHESQMAADSGSAAAIDSNNYSLDYLGEASLDGNPCYLLSLNPKRKEPELIRGQAWVDKRSLLVRHIEGQMAKNPSWMLKKVAVKIDFADKSGAWLQTGMEAVADVRFLGSQTLTSQTVDAHVGDLVARKTPPGARITDVEPNRRGTPAIVIVPLHQSQ